MSHEQVACHASVVLVAQSETEKHFLFLGLKKQPNNKHTKKTSSFSHPPHFAKGGKLIVFRFLKMPPISPGVCSCAGQGPLWKTEFVPNRCGVILPGIRRKRSLETVVETDYSRPYARGREEGGLFD